MKIFTIFAPTDSVIDVLTEVTVQVSNTRSCAQVYQEIGDCSVEEDKNVNQQIEVVTTNVTVPSTINCALEMS